VVAVTATQTMAAIHMGTPNAASTTTMTAPTPAATA
jgi:hypothetical protein